MAERRRSRREAREVSEGVSTSRDWAVDLLVGGLAGGLVGAVVAVNIMIYFGTDDGYEATLSEVIQQNALTGIAMLIALVAGPVLGVFIARRRRRKSAQFVR
jgi:hypothetical protein